MKIIVRFFPGKKHRNTGTRLAAVYSVPYYVSNVKEAKFSLDRKNNIVNFGRIEWEKIFLSSM